MIAMLSANEQLKREKLIWCVTVVVYWALKQRFHCELLYFYFSTSAFVAFKNKIVK